MTKLDTVREDTIQIVQKPFSLGFLVKKIEGSALRNRIINSQNGNVLTASQDAAAIR
jgi:two-component system cell cycle response regulator CpdR